MSSLASGSSSLLVDTIDIESVIPVGACDSVVLCGVNLYSNTPNPSWYWLGVFFVSWGKRVNPPHLHAYGRDAILSFIRSNSKFYVAS